ncbi:hypothetical protein P5V15_002576 [Pogonomyrmex californicus]
MINLLDEEALDHIAESAGKRLWNEFITFGSASAGVLALFIIGRLIKLIIDTLIHGYAIHSIYGWSLYPLWSSVTSLILFLGKSRKDEDSGGKEKTFITEYHPAASVENSTNNAQPGTSEQINKQRTDNDELSYVELRKILLQK